MACVNSIIPGKVSAPRSAVCCNTVYSLAHDLEAPEENPFQCLSGLPAVPISVASRGLFPTRADKETQYRRRARKQLFRTKSTAINEIRRSLPGPEFFAHSIPNRP